MKENKLCKEQCREFYAHQSAVSEFISAMCTHGLVMNLKRGADKYQKTRKSSSKPKGNQTNLHQTKTKQNKTQPKTIQNLLNSVCVSILMRWNNSNMYSWAYVIYAVQDFDRFLVF